MRKQISDEAIEKATEIFLSDEKTQKDLIDGLTVEVRDDVQDCLERILDYLDLHK